MKVLNVTIPVYGETEEEATAMRQAWVNFANGLLAHGCVVSATKTTEALRMWDKNILVKNAITKHYKR